MPHFLGASDLPWLRGLLDDAERFTGRPQRELDDRWREPPPAGSPFGKRRLAIHVLRRLLGGRQHSAVPPSRARAAVFTAAVLRTCRADAMLAVASRFGVTVPELENSLFSDLPGERLVVPAEKPLSPLELSLRTNLALAQGFLFRASSITIEAEGNARALVRHAKLRGLICSVATQMGGSSGDVTLAISGPFALFRRTLVYGRALAELLPLCGWCQRFRLRAQCHLKDGSVQIELASGDPIFPSAEPRRFDSQVEERFARDLGRLARDWDIVREPEPVPSGETLIFPDFALQHRENPARRHLLEIVGFWTADYVARKLAQYRAAGLPNLILCIDEDRDCSNEELPAGATVIRYRRRIDAQAVLIALGAAWANDG